jgi:hypothetical protein
MRLYINSYVSLLFKFINEESDAKLFIDEDILFIALLNKREIFWGIFIVKEYIVIFVDAIKFLYSLFNSFELNESYFCINSCL